MKLFFTLVAAFYISFAAAEPGAGTELIISAQSEEIAGTLVLPDKASNTVPLVIMISGSGAQARDSTVVGFPVFAQLAEHLREAGVASFRFDDRETGQSTGSFGDATLDRLAADVAIIVDHFKVFSEQKFAEVILMGHSQGGIVAGRLASLDHRINRVVLMASPGMNMRRILRQQVADAYAHNSVSAELVEAEILAREEIMYAIADNKDEEEVDAARDAYINAYKKVLESLPAAARAQIVNIDTLARTQAEELRETFSVPQTQSLLFHDPVTDLKGLRMPVLMVFGARDTQAVEALNRPLMEQALQSAGSNYQAVVIPEANHLFQKAENGQASEYALLEKQFAPGFTESITEWINGRTGTVPAR
jgi:pimeloyl-ACP methyl ester carboxylesterase